MTWFKAGIFFLILWLVQTTLLWRIWPFGAAPSLLLCAAVCFCWLYEAYYGLAFAVVFGLLLDIQLGNLFGVWALAFVLAILPAMVLRRSFNPERVLPFLVITLIATLICAFIVWGINSMFGAPASALLLLRALPALFISQAVICIALQLIFVRTIIKHRRDRRYIGGTM